MNTRRLLIAAPIIIIAVLLQSYYWVPTYEQQTRGNPERLDTFITASIGDASLINPILSADSASSHIEGLVFEGLLDRDKELRFRGRLATHWEIYEEAYFYINETAAISGMRSDDARSTAEMIREAKKDPGNLPAALRATLARITDVSVLDGRRFRRTVTARPSPEKRDVQDIVFDVAAPPRIKITLNDVDPDLFNNLSLLLGEAYFETFPSQRYIKTDAPLTTGRLKDYGRQLLPPTEHNPVIVFHLRSGVTFHDGHRVDADDVRFTYEAIMNPKNLSPRVADYEPVKAVTVIDPLTVQIVYKRLYSPAIGTWGMGILPEHLLNDRALRQEAVRRDMDPAEFSMRDSLFNRNPLGCGPFRFREWKSDQYITLERFEDYWEGAPNYETYVFRIIPKPLTREMEFYAGTIDDYTVQPHQVERLKNDDRFQHFSGTSFGYTYIGYNMRRKPFDDRRVRLALGMAIDADKIIRYVLYGQGERITGPFVKQTDYYNQAIEPIPYDPRGALRLLQEAGWSRDEQGWLVKDGKRLEFTLITNSGNELRKAILAIAQDSWKQIGVDVRTDLVEWSVFIQERVNKLDFDALILGWSMGIDPDLYQIWHSSQTQPNQLNFVGFRNPEADRLIIDIRQEYEHDQQVRDCHLLHEIIAHEQPYTFLYVSKWTAVLDKRIVLRTADATGKPVYEKIQPTKTGNYRYDFNQWIKLPEPPNFAAEG
jgi:ABC-type transport system substrate-binding protein